ncbi:MAG: PIG-L family deacetylase [Acidobacteriia bacterium]|nr:PIG-L family deacetylase [Terriglobia bacterium]
MMVIHRRSTGPRNGLRSAIACGPAVAIAAVLIVVAAPRKYIGAQESVKAVRAVTDSISYNVGEVVRLRVLADGANEGSAGDYFVTIRYAGETKPIVEHVRLAGSSKSAKEGGYREVWRIPADARTGRYEIDLSSTDATSHRQPLKLPNAASFAVHRKLLRIERIELGKTFYTPGDPVSCRVVLRNLTDHPFSGLRVEFSERYWPWIAQSSERAGVEAFPIVAALTIKPGTEVEVRSARAAVAKNVAEPTVQQYAVVVWDEQRKTVHDIAFSPLTFIEPPGENLTKPYPLQYVYPSLDAVNTTAYRQFLPAEMNSGAIQFDRSHTMFAPGDTATVKFTLTNPTDQAWRDLKIRASLRSLGSAGFGERVVAEHVDLAPRAQVSGGAELTLPADGGGIYRANVQVSDSLGEVLAENELQLAANPLPASVLIFCAHQDDEGAHAGIIRAAVENGIPIHLVYFTSGDAGSCDRYYEHSCSPAEALNFGALRMEEARASVGHLGVPRENLYFLGLPDGGLGEIWYRHLLPADPYLSVLLASDHSPYEDAAIPNLPYARQSAVEAAKEFIRKFAPDEIYTGHPDERHVDHRTNNWFVVKALQELRREGLVSDKLRLLVDQVYGPGPQAHAPYHYEKRIFYVSGDAMARAQEAQWYYQSQSGNRALGRIRSLDQLPHQQVHWQIMDWQDHEGWNEKD